jgi:hypothetical protein
LASRSAAPDAARSRFTSFNFQIDNSISNSETFSAYFATRKKRDAGFFFFRLPLIDGALSRGIRLRQIRQRSK